MIYLGMSPSTGNRAWHIAHNKCLWNDWRFRRDGRLNTHTPPDTNCPHTSTPIPRHHSHTASSYKPLPFCLKGSAPARTPPPPPPPRPAPPTPPPPPPPRPMLSLAGDCREEHGLSSKAELEPSWKPSGLCTLSV